MSKTSRKKARERQRARRAARAVAVREQPAKPAPRAATAAVAGPPRKVARGPVETAPAARSAVDSLSSFLSRLGFTRVVAIARRDFAGMFVSPVGWVVAAVFVFLVSGFGFIATVLAGQQATMAGVFGVITNFLMVVVIPLLTMRVLAEERAQGTLELLLTSPVRDWEVTAGKWIAVFAFYVLLLATTLVYVVILRIYAAGLDLGLIGATYLGLVLVGGAAIAIGVLASSLTRNQIVAFFVAMALLLVTWYAGYVIGFFVAPPANVLFEYAGGWNRFQAFSLGQAALRDVVYFVTLTFGALFLTTRVLASRRWR
ncbi:MAG TPA: ABC transporter permease subunit [Candidatus Dormibacteraeota bacterium]|nr:ABC transporter permease subunit [Candidatus Dormibacteraeota bacterium]